MADTSTTGNLNADTHTFEFVWSNMIESWHAECSCGEDFGWHGSMESAGRAYDEHTDAVSEAWGYGD